MDQNIIHREDIVRGLQDLGVCRGMALEVHSALSSLGWVEGDAAAVIEALIEAIDPEGTLIMSAYPVSTALPVTQAETARGITWKVRILEDPHERTGLGLIVDTFRQRQGVILGQGLHRVCAWGCDAVQQDALRKDPFGLFGLARKEPR